MTEPAPAADTGARPRGCPLCGGPWIDGRIAVPIVGSLRFVYRLGTNEVATEVAAKMCKDCGHVSLRAREPDLIGRAQEAAAQGPAAQRWPLRAQRPAGEYRSRYGQGTAR
jgi:hypothetical protein